MSTVLAIAKRLDRLEGRFRPRPARMPSAVDLAERAGFVPDPWQHAVLTSIADRVLLNCSRQSGKTSVVALLAVHEAISRPGSLTLMVAPTQRQAAELLRTARQFYARSGGPGLVDTDAESVLSVALRNGSRLLALPGKEAHVRGFAAVGLLLIDEAARVSDDLYVSVRPMIAVSGGRLIALSTPWGKRGWWHAEWSDGAGWERYEVPRHPVSAHPGVVSGTGAAIHGRTRLCLRISLPVRRNRGPRLRLRRHCGGDVFGHCPVVW
jgi:phage terminase large subunit-like protein